MKYNGIIITISILLTVSCVSCSHPLDEIDYQGEKIKLSKSYNDYDQYKNDPNNIDPSEIQRVQHLVINAPIENKFTSRIDASKAIGNIVFPGYGRGMFISQQQNNRVTLLVFLVEIPNAGKERYFVFLEKNSVCTLIDDFIFPDTQGLINKLILRNNNLIFSTIRGEEVLIHRYTDRQ